MSKVVNETVKETAKVKLVNSRGDEVVDLVSVQNVAGVQENSLNEKGFASDTETNTHLILVNKEMDFDMTNKDVLVYDNKFDQISPLANSVMHNDLHVGKHATTRYDSNNKPVSNYKMPNSYEFYYIKEMLDLDSVSLSVVTDSDNISALMCNDNVYCVVNEDLVIKVDAINDLYDTISVGCDNIPGARIATSLKEAQKLYKCGQVVCVIINSDNRDIVKYIDMCESNDISLYVKTDIDIYKLTSNTNQGLAIPAFITYHDYKLDRSIENSNTRKSIHSVRNR